MAETRNTKKKKHYPLIALVYLFTVSVLFVAVMALTRSDTVYISDPAELDDFNFSSHIAYLSPTAFERYSGVLYTPEDFANGRVTHTPDKQDGRSMLATYRILLPLNEGVVYGISGHSAIFAMTLWINGDVYVSIGEPGSSLEDMTPRQEFYTIYFVAGVQPAEIIIQSSSFVHAAGGLLYPIFLAEQPLIISMNSLNNMRVGIMVGVALMAALLFFGLFLFFEERPQLLWFAILCVMVAIRALVLDFLLIITLFPNMSWQLMYRLEFLSTFGVIIFTILYVGAMLKDSKNPYGLNRTIKMCALFYFCAFSAFVMFTPATVHTQPLPIANVLTMSITGLAMLNVIWVIMKDRQRRRNTTHILILLGSVANILLGFAELVLRFADPRFMDINFMQIGAMVFLFINAIALAINFHSTEAELAETKAAEQRLAAENAALDSLSRMKTEYITNVTHETKTPLTIISVYVQQAREVFEQSINNNAQITNKEQEADFKMISGSLKRAQEEIMRVSRLVNNVLWFTSTQESREQMEHLDIGQLIENGAEAYRGFIEKKGNALTINATADLPQILGNADQLLQVMANVLTNANNHTTNGEIKVQITNYESQIEVSITDNGTGIDRELLPRVFERGVTGSASMGGTGMGLPICQSIIESHGGEIWVESVPCEGTIVLFTLPKSQY